MSGPNVHELRPGERLDRYELLALRARGGMGAVWLARLSGKFGISRLFAVKTIRSDVGADASFRAMFLEEARVISHIRDDHVVSIVELGEDRGHLFMAMDWVDGEPLSRYADLVPDGRLPVAIAIRVVL